MIRVLIVDDDALTLEVHTAFVERLDDVAVAATCTGARAALSALVDGAAGEDIDLVLLDMSMPDGTGVDVLRHIRAHGIDVDVIAITGVRDADVVRQTVALGVLQYIVKPFSFAVFRERMEQYRQHHDRRERTVGQATQSEIDALLGADMAPRAEVPKGLSPTTLEAVRDDLRSEGPTTSPQTATRLGLSRVSARRYLEALVAEGVAMRAERHGSRGRPVVEYRWRSTS